MKLMGPFSRREGCPQSPNIIEVEVARSGKIHRLDSNRYFAAEARLETIIKASRLRAEGVEPKKPDKLPKIAILFEAFKSRLPTRNLRTTISPVADTSQSIPEPK